MLPDSGVSGLSLRKLAVQIGVSHNAPYMHFPNKDALLAAIAQYGFQQMQAQFLENSADGWRAQFISGCQIYVRFGTSNPELFQVMFMEHDYEAFPEMAADSLAALQTLTDIIAEGQKQALVRSGDAHEFATLVWSLLHGIAVLNSNRKQAPLPYRQDNSKDQVESFLTEILKGLGV